MQGGKSWKQFERQRDDFRRAFFRSASSIATMKMFSAIAVALLCSAFVFAQEKTLDDAGIKAVLKACNDWDDAYIKKDPAAVEKLLTPDYIGIDEEGAVTSKTDEINLIKTGEYVIFSVEHLEPPKVRFYGGTAIVTTHAKVKQSSKGETSTVIGRATTVCVKQGDEWKIASWHASKMKE
jgi:ketosteroid isomerase-like protein